MIVAGCDVGTLTTKVVIINDKSIVAHDIVATNASPAKAAKQAMDNALAKAGLKFKKVKYCTGTGWGRKKIDFSQKASGEILCLARGARWLAPSVRTIIDVGGQNINLVVLNEKGKVLDHTTNDKCAAGTGKFIELMAEALELDINDFGPLSLQSKKNINLSNQCVVFAESEVISHVNKGEDIADIVSSINQSIVSRLVTMVKRVGLKEDVCLVGGVGKNSGIVKKLEDMLEIKILTIPEDSQIVGALGAAVIAGESIR
jgi:(R)-2-hydroxyacyl-CoA dehydratese activating ATPase